MYSHFRSAQRYYPLQKTFPIVKSESKPGEICEHCIKSYHGSTMSGISLALQCIWFDHLECMKQAIRRSNLEMNIREKIEYTRTAALRGSMSCLIYLVDHGAKINDEALSFAALGRHFSLVRYIHETCQIGINKSVLFYTLLSGSTEIMDYLLLKTEEQVWTLDEILQTVSVFKKYPASQSSALLKLPDPIYPDCSMDDCSWLAGSRVQMLDCLSRLFLRVPKSYVISSIEGELILPLNSNYFDALNQEIRKCTDLGLRWMVFLDWVDLSRYFLLRSLQEYLRETHQYKLQCMEECKQYVPRDIVLYVIGVYM